MAKRKRISKADAKRAERRAAARRKADAPRAEAGGKAAGPPSERAGSRVASGDQQPSGDEQLTRGPTAKEKHLSRAKARSRKIYADAAELGALPPVKDPERRARCADDAWAFIHAYCLAPGMAELSALHKTVVDNIARSMIDGDLYAQAIARGFAKTTIAIWCIVWAALNGHCRYLVLFGYDKPAAIDLLEDVKAELLENEALLEDYPEVLVAVRAIDGNNQRARSQTHEGEKTLARWQTDLIVLPKCGDSVAGLCVIRARPQGNARGLRYRLPNGQRQRPDYFLADDVENDDTAASARRVESLIGRIFKAWIPMAGHFGRIAGVINGTIAARGAMIDQATDPDNSRFAMFKKVRVPLVQSWANPDAHKRHWLGEYRNRLIAFASDDEGACAAAESRATRYYLDHREEMDAGCVVSWEGAVSPGEVSAIQHAYNLLIRIGAEAFATECQQDPLVSDDEAIVLPATVIVRKQHGLEPGVLDPGTTHVICVTDQQDTLLYWVVAAFGDHLSGHVVDYGSWPDQGLGYFSLKQAEETLQEYYSKSPLPEHGGVGADVETDAALTLGLTDLTANLFARRWPVAGGGQRGLDLFGVDVANGNRTKILQNWMLHSPHFARLIGMQGVGVTAKRTPLAGWERKKGERRGIEWIERRVGDGVRHAFWNTNYHAKGSFDALRLPHGSVGSLALPKVEDPAMLQMLADHTAARTCVKVTANERSVHEFSDKPGADNHLGDCLIGLRPLAMIAGVTPPGSVIAKTPPGTFRRKKRRAKRLG